MARDLPRRCTGVDGRAADCPAGGSRLRKPAPDPGWRQGRAYRKRRQTNALADAITATCHDDTPTGPARLFSHFTRPPPSDQPPRPVGDGGRNRSYASFLQRQQNPQAELAAGLLLCRLGTLIYFQLLIRK